MSSRDVQPTLLRARGLTRIGTALMAVGVLVASLLGAAATGAAAGTTSPSSAARAADVTVPILNAFAMNTTALSPGDQVSINYQASDDAGALSCVIFSFRDPVGGVHQIRADGAVPLTGTVTDTVPATWPNGPAPLIEVTLCDPVGNQIRYARDGSTWKFPSGATGPSTHTFDFSAGDVSVSGSTADTAVPTLTSFRRWPAPSEYRPGDQISMQYQADDAAGALSCVIFSLRDPVGNVHQIRADGEVALAGTVTAPVGPNWTDGIATLVEVTLCDPTGNQIRYARDGSTWKFPSGATGPSNHTHAFAEGDLRVTGSNADTEVPYLTGFTIADRVLAAGEQINVAYEASDAAESLSCVIFSFRDPVGNIHQVRMDGTVALAGTLTETVGENWAPGIARLVEVTLCDPTGNQVRLARDGSTRKFPSGAVGPDTHEHNLAAGDLAVDIEAQAPTPVTEVAATAGDQEAEVTWLAGEPGSPAVATYEVLATPVAGLESPHGYERTVQVQAPDGVRAGQRVTTTVPDLINAMTYTFSVRAINDIGTSAAVASEPVRVGLRPTSPARVQAESLRGQVVVDWQPGTQTKSPVTGYTIITTPEPGATTADGTPVPERTEPTSSPGGSISTLVEGVRYAVTVVAHNEVGDSDPSAPVWVVARPRVEAPQAPTGVKVQALDRALDVDWQDVTDTGGVPLRDYVVTATPVGPGSEGVAERVINTGTTTSGLLGALTNGVTYSITVTATNQQGLSAISDPVTVAPAGVPGRVGEPRVTVKQTFADRRKNVWRLVVAWQEPVSQGAPVTGYQVSRKKVGGSGETRLVKADVRRWVFRGVERGRHAVQVRALSEAGPGPRSAKTVVKAR